MKINANRRLKKRNSNSAKKFTNTLNAPDTQGKPIDLSGSSGGDGLDDDLDLTPSPAIIRLQSLSKASISNAINVRKKAKRKKPKIKLHRHRPSPIKAPKTRLRVATIGPDSTPELDDKPIRSLWLCNSIQEVAAEHAKWGQRFNEKCLKGIAKRKLADRTKTIIEALLDGSATDAPILTNNRMLAMAGQDVHRKLMAAMVDEPDIEFALVTYIEGDGGTSSDTSLIELHHSRNKVIKVTRSMSKNFIGVTELAMFNSYRHLDGGRHIQRHEHVLIWGVDILGKAQQVARRRMKEFTPNITGAPQIDVRHVSSGDINLARVCAYLFKSPHKCKNWNPPKDDKNGHMNHSEKCDRMIRYLRMAQIRSMMTIEDVMFAGGQGIAIRSDLIKLLRQTCRSEVPIQQRLLHPDEIVTFWAEVNKALNRPDMRVPIIARRP